MRVTCAHYHVLRLFLLFVSPLHIASMNMIIVDCLLNFSPDWDYMPTKVILIYPYYVYMINGCIRERIPQMLSTAVCSIDILLIIAHVGR